MQILVWQQSRAYREETPTEPKYSHMHEHKIFILSKDDMKASSTDTEQAFVYAEGCYFLFSWLF